MLTQGWINGEKQSDKKVTVMLAWHKENVNRKELDDDTALRQSNTNVKVIEEEIYK